MRGSPIRLMILANGLYRRWSSSSLGGTTTPCGSTISSGQDTRVQAAAFYPSLMCCSAVPPKRFEQSNTSPEQRIRDRKKRFSFQIFSAAC
jgi:hypothetical protein